MNKPTLEQFVNDSYSWAHSVVEKRLYDPVDADDATQEIFIRVMRSYHKFQGNSNPRTWLFRIIANTIHDWNRKVAHRRDQHPCTVDDIAGSLCTAGDPVYHEVRQEEKLALAEQMIENQLTGWERKTLKASAIEEVTHKEGYESMRVKYHTYCTYLSSAKATMRKLKEELEDAE
jgi:RNA polymerase sigma-70 factor (ECF subfamily)